MENLALQELVTRALIEDIGPGDLTTALTVDPRTPGTAQAIAREELVVSGLAVFQEVFRQVDGNTIFEAKAKDGDLLKAGEAAALVQGQAASILTAERVGLNFLSHLSGVATQTRNLLLAMGEVKTRLVDTRKTTPGLRFLEKAAVRHGGGHNHRFALYDGIMIKDNHIKAAGSISQALFRAKTGAPHMLKIEVEIDRLDQLEEALVAGADIILLDNMGPAELKEAVRLSTEFFSPGPRKVLLEASGGITLSSIKEVAATGVDLISSGALTHSAPARDFGLDWLT